MKRGLIACLVCLLASSAFGAETDSARPSSAAQLFVTKATQDGLTEVELGKLAQTRSSDPAVKAFGEQMVKDHGKANEELRAIAKAKQLNSPTSLDGDHARIVHSLSAKPSREFDAEYARRMVEAHDAAIVLFTDATAMSDKELSGFAEKTLPTLKLHQQMAAALPANAPKPPEPPDPAVR